MIFYFSATGNSLYAAKRFSDTPVSIPQIMRGTERQFSDDAIGIVCPVYAGEPPKMVKRFLRESSFQADYFYFVLTFIWRAARQDALTTLTISPFIIAERAALSGRSATALIFILRPGILCWIVRLLKTIIAAFP